MSKPITYRPDIDGLRAVAVLSVVLHHVSPAMFPGGFIGVDIFFVISGYLITSIIKSECDSGRFSLATFYERRVRRIVPPLVPVLLFVMVVGWVVYLPTDYSATLRAAVGTATLSSNILFWRDLQEGYFAADAKENALLHMWSLGVEEQFYLLFPAIFLVVLRVCPRRLLFLLVFAAGLSLVLAEVAVRPKPVATFFLLPFRAWELLVGCILAVAKVPDLRSRAAREIVSIIALTTLVGSIFIYSTETIFPGLTAVVPVLAAAAAIHVGRAEGSALTRALSAGVVVHIGVLSYSLYLWHWPVVVFTKYVLGLEALGMYGAGVLVVSYLLAWTSYRLVERPLRYAFPNVGAGRVLKSAFATLAIVAIIAGVGVASDGLPSRWSREVLTIDEVRQKKVPYRGCDGKFAVGDAGNCIVGDSSAAPDVLLWGDSHLLAWLPGFDVALKEQGRSALIATHSACPPMLGVNNGVRESCRIQNDRVSEFLDSDPSIRKIILAARWEKYFEESNIELSDSSGSQENSEISVRGLQATIGALMNSDREILILGPVPTYSSDVPKSVALGIRGIASPIPLKSLDDVRQENVRFYDFVRTLNQSGVALVDVAEWICNLKCEVFEGEILYRDSNHLSPYGSVRYSKEISTIVLRNSSEHRLKSFNSEPQ